MNPQAGCKSHSRSIPFRIPLASGGDTLTFPGDAHSPQPFFGTMKSPDGCFPRVPLLLYFDHLTVLLFPGAVGHYQREEEEKEVRPSAQIPFWSCRASSDERSLRHHLPPAPIPKGNKSPPSDLLSAFMTSRAGRSRGFGNSLLEGGPHPLIEKFII